MNNSSNFTIIAHVSNQAMLWESEIARIQDWWKSTVKSVTSACSEDFISISPFGTTYHRYYTIGTTDTGILSGAERSSVLVSMTSIISDNILIDTSAQVLERQHFASVHMTMTLCLHNFSIIIHQLIHITLNTVRQPVSVRIYSWCERKGELPCIDECWVTRWVTLVIWSAPLHTVVYCLVFNVTGTRTDSIGTADFVSVGIGPVLTKLVTVDQPKVHQPDAYIAILTQLLLHPRIPCEMRNHVNPFLVNF